MTSVDARRSAAASQQRTALSLLEVLTVIAIAGVLVALTLSAVQAARESSRRLACANNLRQLAIGSAEYENVRGTYPPGYFGDEFGDGPNSRAWNWAVSVLPYIEEGTLYSTIGAPRSYISASPGVDSRIQLLWCPSDASGRDVRLNAGNLVGLRIGPSNYKGVSGKNWGYDHTLGGWLTTGWTSIGANSSYDGLSDGDGLMWRTAWQRAISTRSALDGTSNIFLFGEDVQEENVWCSWPYANNGYGTCAIPPNHEPNDPNNFADSWSFRSRHPNGLQFALADGSVRFVADNIALNEYRSLASRCDGVVSQ
jgi:prepilin-type processing-associated H-X9-DG protein